MKQLMNVQRYASPVVTPQALAWDSDSLWLSSRDLGTLCRLDGKTLKVVREIDAPGVVWAAVSSNGGAWLTIGKGLNDDRYVYSYCEEDGFTKLFACPEFTGSYLSFDGTNHYLSLWYKGEIHQINASGAIQRTINVGAEICGHAFANETLYVLRGRENKDIAGAAEDWRIARCDLREETPAIEDLATVPFASRSLTFDGNRFWSNYRAANEIVSFTL